MQKKVREEPGQDGQDSDLQTEVLTERCRHTDKDHEMVPVIDLGGAMISVFASMKKGSHI